MTKQLRILPIAIAIMLVIGACSSIDCPLNSTVRATYSFKGETDTLKDTLTVMAVRANREDSVILNRGINLTSMALPMSYTQDEDVLALVFTHKDGTQETDTIWISKDNMPHFESVDCSPQYFHTLTGIRCTHTRIDDIVINNPSVDYDETKENIFIYFRSDD